jgi:predicted amidohydrolase YtcJ
MFMVDLILHNANVMTMDITFPRARSVAIQDGKILEAAGDDSLKGLRDSNTMVLDCGGKTILPGFIDSHLHFFAMAESCVTLNLEPCNHIGSVRDIQAKIRQSSQGLPSGTWIRGRGYNEFYLAEKRHPNRWDLDSATTLHPIKLTHRSGHAHALNSLALDLVGVSRETADPPEGLIERDVRTGEPTGILYGMGDHLSRLIPPLARDQMERGVAQASTELNSLGITSVQDASPGNNLARWKMLQIWKERGLLKSRVNMALGTEGFAQHLNHPFTTPLSENQLNLGGVKIVLHEITGQMNPRQEELNERVLLIHQAGLQVIFHAIEEKAIEAACIAIEFALRNSPKLDHRHRIEHCSVCTPSLAKRIASLGVMVITQPSFTYYHGERYLKTVPASDLRYLYPIATLMKNGVKVIGSSDCPIVPANPLIGIYAATSRMAETGELVLPEERISLLDAIKMYTSEAAKATFEEPIKGSIAPGKLADLVVVNGDPTRLPTDEIKDLKVEMTILNGEIVWNKMS